MKNPVIVNFDIFSDVCQINGLQQTSNLSSASLLLSFERLSLSPIMFENLTCMKMISVDLIVGITAPFFRYRRRWDWRRCFYDINTATLSFKDMNLHLTNRFNFYQRNWSWISLHEKWILDNLKAIGAFREKKIDTDSDQFNPSKKTPILSGSYKFSKQHSND